MLAKLKADSITARNKAKEYMEFYQQSQWPGYALFARMEQYKELRVNKEIKKIEAQLLKSLSETETEE